MSTPTTLVLDERGSRPCIKSCMHNKDADKTRDPPCAIPVSRIRCGSIFETSS